MSTLESILAAIDREIDEECEHRPRPLMIPPAVAERCIAELGAIPEGVEVTKPMPEPVRILIVDGGRDMSGIAMRLAAGLRVMGGTVTIALHNEVPRDADVTASVDVERGAVTMNGYAGEFTVTAEARRLIQAIGRMNYGAASAGLDLLPREPSRKAQWKQEVAGRPDQHRRTGKRR